jgi:hypothetical protein
MSDPTHDRLDDYRFQFGPDAGDLSMALDHLTDAVRLANLVGVYRSGRGGQVPDDVRELLALITSAKGLVQQTLLRLKGVG